MLAKVRSCAIIGLCGEFVEVEASLSNEPTTFAITGLSDATLNSLEKRVRSAIQNSGYLFPAKGIIASLVPTDLPTESTFFDLPIALAVLLASGQINPSKQLDESLFLGELFVDGSLRHTNGVLPVVASASEKQVRSIYVPATDILEASLVRGVMIYPVKTLAQLLAHLKGEQQIEPYVSDPHMFDDIDQVSYKYDVAMVRGQEHVKRALEVATSGMHNILMSGPPRSGKLFLARCIPSILPRLTMDESFEITKLYSASGMLSPHMPLILQRSFRAPHHSISHVKLVGDGCIPCPGEMSLAHHGVFFLHELSEFGQNILEVLFQPLEDKVVTISRVQGKITYPANFILVASMKPCPCGFINDPVKKCSCSAMAISRYQKKIRGPLLDRIDIHIEVPRIDYEKLADKRQVEDSKTIRARVQTARERQLERFKGTKMTCNAEMGPTEVREFCQTDVSGEKLLKSAVQQLHVSARAYHRVLKLARTIADLADSEMIAANHVAEAMQYRPRVGM
jgi:magnesium chelatase family protein